VLAVGGAHSRASQAATEPCPERSVIEQGPAGDPPVKHGWSWTGHRPRPRDPSGRRARRPSGTMTGGACVPGRRYEELLAHSATRGKGLPRRSQSAPSSSDELGDVASVRREGRGRSSWRELSFFFFFFFFVFFFGRRGVHAPRTASSTSWTSGARVPRKSVCATGTKRPVGRPRGHEGSARRSAAVVRLDDRRRRRDERRAHGQCAHPRSARSRRAKG
jgi:hypothetical protein